MKKTQDPEAVDIVSRPGSVSWDLSLIIITITVIIVIIMAASILQSSLCARCRS